MTDRNERQTCLSRAAHCEAHATQIDEKITAMTNEAREYRALAERLRGRAALLATDGGTNGEA